MKSKIFRMARIVISFTPFCKVEDDGVFLCKLEDLNLRVHAERPTGTVIGYSKTGASLIKGKGTYLTASAAQSQPITVWREGLGGNPLLMSNLCKVD